MITRFVKLTFKEREIPTFIQIWEESRIKISSFEGCRFVEMFQSKSPENVCFTYSIWESEDALNKYRHSDLFQKTWARTKALFDGKPEAWTTDSHGFGGNIHKQNHEKDTM